MSRNKATRKANKVLPLQVLALITVACPIQAALRGVNDTTKQLEEFSEQCSSVPILHDVRGLNDPHLIEYQEYYKNWMKKKYTTIWPDSFWAYSDLFTTIPEGNFVYWKFETEDMYAPEMVMSAYNDYMAVMGSYKASPYVWKYVLPETQDFGRIQETLTLIGDYAVFISAWQQIYQHILIDHLGYLAYLKDTLPSTTRILLACHRPAKIKNALFSVLDPHFSNRIDFIDCATGSQCSNMKVQVRGGSLTVMKPRSSPRHLKLLQLSRNWIQTSYPSPRLLKDEEKTVIYYTRNTSSKLGGKVYNGRVMAQHQEKAIIRMIKQAMRKFGRKEKLVVFDGNGSFNEQIDLFRSATTVIGPHGGGLANILFMMPSSSCISRPKVLEFVTSPETPRVQFGYFWASYFELYSTVPWVELHHVLFKPPSNEDTTYVNLDSVQIAINALFDESNNNSAISF